MGQKIHPLGLRVGIIRDWDAKWYAEKDFAAFVHEDLRLENFLKRENCNIEIAMHGWDHYGKPSEILGQKYETEF